MFSKKKLLKKFSNSNSRSVMQKILPEPNFPTFIWPIILIFGVKKKFWHFQETMPTYPSYRGVFSAKKNFSIRTKIWRKIQNQKWPTPYEAKFERAISQPQVTSPRHSYGLIYLPGSSLGRHEKFRKKSKIHRDIEIFRKKSALFKFTIDPLCHPQFLASYCQIVRLGWVDDAKKRKSWDRP